MRTFVYSVLLIIFASLWLTGCADMMPEERIEASSVPELSVQLRRNLRNAEAFFSEIGEATRTPRRVESVEPICASLTRSASADTLLYLVNYADDQGFAILGNSDENDIYAISPEGHMSAEDIRGSEVLQGYVASCLIDAVNSIPTLKPDSTKINVTARRAPMLNGWVVKWYQEGPYNKYCPFNFKRGERFAVGCRVLSLAMVMSYYRWPVGTTYKWRGEDKYSFDWDAIMPPLVYATIDTVAVYSETAKMLAFLRNDVLNGEGIPNNSTTSVSYSDLRASIPLLGYRDKLLFERALLTSHEVERDFVNFLLVGGESADSKWFAPAPVMVEGFDKMVGNTNLGHQWVIDGLVVRSKMEYYGIFQSIVEKYYFYRCVWGWKNTKQNGYYRFLSLQDMGDPQQYLPLIESNTIYGGISSVTIPDGYFDWSIIGGMMKGD